MGPRNLIYVRVVIVLVLAELLFAVAAAVGALAGSTGVVAVASSLGK